MLLLPLTFANMASAPKPAIEKTITKEFNLYDVKKLVDREKK